jgi:hypothetical protein
LDDDLMTTNFKLAEHAQLVIFCQASNMMSLGCDAVAETVECLIAHARSEILCATSKKFISEKHRASHCT